MAVIFILFLSNILPAVEKPRPNGASTKRFALIRHLHKDLAPVLPNTYTIKSPCIGLGGPT